MDIKDFILSNNLAVSKSQCRRLIAQGGVIVNGERIHELNMEINPETDTVQVGKRVAPPKDGRREKE